MSSISEVLSDLGYLGLALAGYLVGQGHFEFVPALIAATAGSLVGAVLLEGAARRRPFAARFLRFAHQDAATLGASSAHWPHPRSCSPRSASQV